MEILGRFATRISFGCQRQTRKCRTCALPFSKTLRALSSGKLKVRVLPDNVFGLIHGKAGVITFADGTKTSFMGSANESKSAWRLNYELVWEDDSPEAIAWVQEEFDALWSHPQHVPLSDAIVHDFERLSKRRVFHSLEEWKQETPASLPPDPMWILNLLHSHSAWFFRQYPQSKKV